MAATVHREGNLDLLSGKVAVLGYGSQGHAHALNLRDSGVDVEVGLREGSSSWAAAEDAGLTVKTFAEAVRGAQLVAVLLPDHVQKGVYEQRRRPESRAGRRRPLRPRLQRPLRADPARAGARRDHGRPQGARAPRPRSCSRPARASPALVAVAQDASGSALDLALAYGTAHRLRAHGDDRDDVRGGDRERPLRRAGRPVRRRLRARCRPATRSSWTPATSPRSPTTSASTS